MHCQAVCCLQGAYSRLTSLCGSREPEPQPAIGGGLPPAADMDQELKVYIEHLYISPLHLSVSFLPASWADISTTSGRTAAAGTP